MVSIQLDFYSIPSKIYKYYAELIKGKPKWNYLVIYGFY